MKYKKWAANCTVCIVALFCWVYWPHTTTEWVDEVPPQFRGSWKLIEDKYHENYGIRSIHLSANRIVLDIVYDETEKESRKSPIRKVSITASEGSVAGKFIIFYGPADDDFIAKNRLQINFGSKQKIFVQEIVATGWGEDHWFDVGEFVKVQ